MDQEEFAQGIRDAVTRGFDKSYVHHQETLVGTELRVMTEVNKFLSKTLTSPTQPDKIKSRRNDGATDQTGRINQVNWP